MNNDLVTFAIKANGKLIPDAIEVISIELSLIQLETSQAVLHLFPTNDQDFSILDSDLFEIDSLIEIEVGYNSQDTTLFSGQVLSQELSISQADGPLVIIVCEGANTDDSENNKLKLAYGENLLDLHVINQISGVEGQVTFQGVEVLPGQTVILDGVGDLFNGPHNVHEVTHHIGSGNWITEAGLGLAGVDEGVDAL